MVKNVTFVSKIRKNRYFDDLGPNSRFSDFGGPKMGPLFDPLFEVFEILGVLGKPRIWTTLGPSFWKNDHFLEFWPDLEKGVKKGVQICVFRGVPLFSRFFQNRDFGVKKWRDL